jgi:CheY-like chemotaxis protein
VAQEKGLEFEVNISRNLPQSIESDEQRIIQIIRNFMSNAFKFTESGKVGLSVAKAKLSSLPFELKDKKGDFIQFTVSDSGIGISKDKQRIIFEAFQQAEGSTSRKFGGTGLGLAISRAMTELLGGQITVDSEEGNGSIFSLILPLNIDVNQSRSAAKNKEVVIEYSKKHNVTPAKHSKTKRSKPKILIVEDDKDFIEIISDFSKEYGYLVYEATTGKEAIELAEEELPDAIILDLGLPDIDGIKVLEHLKDNLRTRDIPVHVISAREESEEIKARGAIGFLKKPATEETLADVFDQFKSAHQDEIKNVLVVEDNKSNQQAIYELIENEPINIHTVETGQAAIEYAKSNQIDCIILDLKLPDIPGLEVLKKLDNCLDKIPPVVIYTGRELTQEEDAELQKYSSSIVLKGGSSSNRLLDEVTLFLHSIEKEISVPSQKVVRMMHSGNEILKNKKVLLVDDDMRNVFALSSELEDCSLEVVIASNGEQAIRKLDEETNVDIVLMDIMMPVMNGNTAIEKIREDKRFEDLPIIALTAKAMAGDKEKCIKSGANDYIAKPIDVEQLISMIKVWLAK